MKKYKKFFIYNFKNYLNKYMNITNGILNISLIKIGGSYITEKVDNNDIVQLENIQNFVKMYHII